MRVSLVCRALICRTAVMSGSATLLVLSGLGADGAVAAELPVPCVAGACGPAVTGWLGSGSASAVSAGNTLTVNQTTANAVLNWQSFNISADGKVEFKQPDASAVALNRIFQNSPARILGTLTANGTVYLINQNGILFGSTAQVNVGGLLASTLDVTPQAVDGLLNAVTQSAPALDAFRDGDGHVLSGDVHVERGAKLSAPGGQILLAGSNVLNEGNISAAGGQVILAAGDTVYLAANADDPNLRGLLVEVGKGGTVTNAGPSAAGGSDAGRISADRGNVTLIGLMVNQSGRVSATTSVRENGSVRLLARDGGFVNPTSKTLQFSNEGSLTLGAGSHTDVSLELESAEKAVDATAQLPSIVELEGREVTLAAGSRITAPAGSVKITARGDVSKTPDRFEPSPGEGRLVIEPDAVIDVSGATIDKTMESNVLRVELRGTQLADSPEQRDGALRGKAVYVDIRQSGTRSDGSAWYGSPIADLAGDISAIQKSVGERSLAGGSISLASDGAALIYSQSVLDVSGGAINYHGGYLNTTQLLGANGKVYDIGAADRDRTYAGITSAFTVEHPKWGVTDTFPLFGAGSQGHYEAGYVEGKDAGTVSIIAPRVALDGTIEAKVTVGPYQRNLPTAVPAGFLYRPYNQLPLTGSLVLGSSLGNNDLSNSRNYVLDALTIASGLTLPGLTNEDGSAFDPLQDPLPAGLDGMRLRPELLGSGHIGRLSVYANGRIVLPQDSTLALPTAGSVSFEGGVVDVRGSIVAPSGSVRLSAITTTAVHPDSGQSALTLASGSAIDVAGRWVNDAQLPGHSAPPTDPLALNGGSVTLTTGRGTELDLQSGSTIDASAGARRDSAGGLHGGRGGDISVTAATSIDVTALPVHIDSTFKAFALSQGGSLSITANSVCIASGECSAADTTGEIRIDPLHLTDGGFSSLALSSNVGGVEVAPGTIVQARQLNYVLNGDLSLRPSGVKLDAFATTAVLPAQVRQPFSLALNARPAAANPFTRETFADAGILEIGRGAIIDLDPLASLTLSSSSSLVVNGELSAPAGNISLKVTNDLSISEFLPNQGLWLGESARLLAAGTAQLVADDRGVVTGRVLDGGSVGLSALRGYVVMHPGALIDVSGTAADVSANVALANGSVPNLHVASAGGSVALTAAEGMLVYGSLHAASGGGNAAGGSLSVLIDGELHNRAGVTALDGQDVFPLGAREIRFVDNGPVIVSPEATVPLAYSGTALVSVPKVMAAGFDAMAFTARDLIEVQGPPGERATALINFTGDTKLAARASLALNAPRIKAAPGAHVALDSAYLALGNDDGTAGRQAGAVAATGTASLDAHGALIDVIGNLGLDGFASSALRSDGDIRLRGVQSQSSGEVLPIAGSLRARGSLLLEAQQIYPTTMSQFDIVMDGDETDHLRIAGVPGTAGAVLSAGGTLHIIADEVDQSGTLRAPFGTIDIEAERVTLAPGSLTSTSGAGTLTPFGTIQTGKDWTYPLPLGQTALFTQSGPPAQKITLQGATVDVQSGATVDVSGGGDLQAYEFVPGVTGTQDVLANDFAPGQFAVVPGLKTAFAPYDTSEQASFAYEPGDSVYLSGIDGLPAGEYAILPARYALLPGAFLVRPVSGYTDAPLGTALSRLDGSYVVSGYRAQAGTSIRDSRTSGFAVTSGAELAKLAQYKLSKATDFFSAAASAQDVAPPRLPGDSGQLQLIATAQLGFGGQLRASPGTGGRGALVDVSSDKLQLTNGSDATPLEGYVALDAAQFNSLGAESLLIGGLRTQSGGTITLQTSATELRVDEGAHLTGRDIMLAASDLLSVGEGATIESSGAAVTELAPITVDGSGSILRVASGPQADISRTNGGTGGKLELAAGSVLRSSGAVLLESSGDVSSRASYDLAGASLGFSVSHLSLGAAPESTPGLVLAPSELSGLGLSELSLASRSAISVYGEVALDIGGDLRIDAPGVRAMSEGATAHFGAKDVILHGSSADTDVATPYSGSTLAFDAQTLELEGGKTSFAGFGTASLTARDSLGMTDAGGLDTDGNLRIDTPLLYTATGVDFALGASRSVQLLNTPGAAAPPPDTAGVGGKLLISGERIDVSTHLVLPAGIVAMTATGTNAADGLSLGAGSSIDVSGFERVFDGQSLTASGGTVHLESASGNVSSAAGSVIDVSGFGSSGTAGRLEITAANGAIELAGTLRGHGGAGKAGGEIALDANLLPDLGVLNASLNQSGFTAARAFRQRGPGDLVLAAGTDDAIRAASVKLAADNGSVIVQGAIDASGPRGGSVLLTASNDIDISGSIRANATGDGNVGGRIRLDSDQGGILVRNGASIDLSGGANGDGGALSLRASRDALLTLTDSDSGNDRFALAPGSITGAGEVTVEGFKAYDSASGVMGSGGVIGAAQVAASASNPLFADAADFMAQASAITTALDPSRALGLRVLPGIEIRSDSDLTLSQAWNLYDWRFNGAPGVLTLRAAGNIDVKAALSDGFASPTTFTLPDTPGHSWSYQLVAGADLGASDVMETGAPPAGGGSITLERGVAASGTLPPKPVMIRTGDGHIEMAAAGNLELVDARTSLIYTAGTAAQDGVVLNGLRSSNGSAQAYPEHGGDIDIRVGGDIVGAPTKQLVTDWLWRTGQREGARLNSPGSATAWSVNFRGFEQGIGALAGGNVSIRAGGDIRDLSVSIASIGKQVGGTTAAANAVQVTGGGILDVRSGGDILGGSYFVGRGSSSLRAGGRIGADTAEDAASVLAPVLAMGDTAVTMSARGNVDLEAAVDPFLLAQGRSQGVTATAASYFALETDNTSLSLLSTAGDIQLINNPDRPGGLFATTLSSLTLLPKYGKDVLRFYPTTLAAGALSGDIDFRGGGSLAQWPSSSGGLTLLAEGNIDLDADHRELNLWMADTDPLTALPTAAAPDFNIEGRIAPALFLTTQAITSHVPIHSAAFREDGQSDPNPIRIVAATGDVLGLHYAYAPKPVRVVAGRDIVSPSLHVANLDDSSLSLLSAGRDIVYPATRDPLDGKINAASNVGIQVEGPGRLVLQAGRNIDLGTSNGVLSMGNLLNPLLPDRGADISLLAGLGGGVPQVAAFIDRYLEQGSLYDDLLLAYVRARAGNSATIDSKAKALQVLRSLGFDAQYALAEAVLFAEIRAGGRTAAAPGPAHDDYSRSFTALETMYPRSTAAPDAGDGAKNPYHGDISLYFSQVYTQSGGDIFMSAPGGSINVGLATPPAAFGITKKPSQLGIVVQRTGNINALSYRDFEVEESRTFAADGGDILVWSTQGDIDAGRGAKTAISAPPPTVKISANGQIETVFPAALTGSGIQALATSAGTKPGDVDLFAPRGVVNAGDAGIVAGNLTIGATAVLGRDNIQVSGVSVGVPVDAGGLGASLVGASSVASSASNTATAMATEPNREQSKAPIADAALGWLDVFIEGFGQDVCKPADAECLGRQKERE